MSKPERRGRRGSGRQRQAGPQASWADTPIGDVSAARSPHGVPEQEDGAAEDVKQLSHPVSILKEIFPEHGSIVGQGQSICAAPVPNVLEQLLGSIATPVRRGTPPIATTQWNSAAPLHAATVRVSPAMPPPPPSMPAPGCHAPQESWEMPQSSVPAHDESASASYRERLRAGGRGAFQRSIDSGLTPKTMNQWSAMQTNPAQGFESHQAEMQSAVGMQYMSGYDGQQMWMGAEQMQNNQCWGTPVEQAQYQYMPQVPQGQPQHMQMSMQMPYAMMAEPQQMASMNLDEQSLQVLQMQQPQQLQLPQMQGTQLEWPQTPMSQMQTGTPTMSAQGNLTPMSQMQTATPTMSMMSGESTPSEMDRCMAIVMPQTQQFQCDKDLMALQLKAAAELQQCYED